MILRISYINCLLSLERLCRSKLGTLHDTLLQQLHPTKPVVTICCIFHGDFKFSHHQNVTFYRFLQYHFTFLCWNSSWEFVFEHPRILRILNSPAMSSHVQPSPAISSLHCPVGAQSFERHDGGRSEGADHLAECCHAEFQCHLVPFNAYCAPEFVSRNAKIC